MSKLTRKERRQQLQDFLPDRAAVPPPEIRPTLETPSILDAHFRAGIGGPVTPAGKARSARNSFKHGLASGFNHFRFLTGENPADYFELLHDLTFQFVPRTGAESKKIEDMAQAWWLQRRARNLQTSALESADNQAFALYMRYEVTQRRSYQMAYKDFQDMCKHRLLSAASPDLTPAMDNTPFTSDRIYPTKEPPPASDPPVDDPLAA